MKIILQKEAEVKFYYLSAYNGYSIIYKNIELYSDDVWAIDIFIPHILEKGQAQQSSYKSIPKSLSVSSVEEEALDSIPVIQELLAILKLKYGINVKILDDNYYYRGFEEAQ